MGAAQFVLAPAEFAEVEMRVAELASTCRVLVVAHVDGFTEDGEMVGTARSNGRNRMPRRRWTIRARPAPQRRNLQTHARCIVRLNARAEVLARVV